MTLFLLLLLFIHEALAQEMSYFLDLQAQVSQVRGLPFRTNVPVGTQSREEVIALRIAEHAESLEATEERAALIRAFRKFGFFGGVEDPDALLLRLDTEQVGAYYRPETDELYLIRGLDLLLQEPSMVHELNHALTDQHFDLTALMREAEERGGEAQVALDALIEGDATYVMTQSLMHEELVLHPKSGRFSDVMRERLQKEYKHLPPLLRETLFFSYFDGFDFILFGKTYVGWSAINKAYADPPVSTEQILHPERYFVSRDEPTPVSLPDVQSILGPLWQMSVTSTIGELGIRSLLQTFLQAARSATRYADGWDGDTFIAYERGEEICLVWMSEWDRPEDAHEFYRGMDKLLREKDPAGETIIRRPDLTVRGNRQDGKVTLLDVQGSRVLLLEDVPYDKAMLLYGALAR